MSGLPVLDQIRPTLLYVWDSNTLSAKLWDGSTNVANLTIGRVQIQDGFNLGSFDYVSLATGSNTDTYTFKTGGAGGSTVGTVTITYTDATKATISTVVKT